MAAEKVKDPCLVCNETVARKTGRVQCNFCELWAHPKCVKVSVQHLKALAEQPGMTWTCERCRTLSMKLQKQIQALNRNQQLLDERISKNTNAIADNKNSITSLKKKVENIDKDVIVNNSVAKFSKELKERKKKEYNVILHQFEEPPNTLDTNFEKKEWDIVQAIQLFKSIQCPCTSNDIKFVFRLKSNNSEDMSTRPLLVGFRSTDRRNKVLSNAYKLAEMKSNVSIIPDLTPLQRDEEKKLREKAMELNENMEMEESLNWEWRLVGMKGEMSDNLHRHDDKDVTSVVSNAKVEADGASGTQSSFYYNGTYSPENDITFVITPNTSAEELIEWLDSNKPSEIGSRFDNTIWINLYWVNSIEKDEAKEAAVKQLWKEATEISYDSVIDIAKRTGYLQGKWVISSLIAAVDKDWKTVAMGILNKEFGDDVLKATVDCKKSRIRIYTKDITCPDEIFSCESKLREVTGYRGWMNYSPEIFPLIKIGWKKCYFEMYRTGYKKNGTKIINTCQEVNKLEPGLQS